LILARLNNQIDNLNSGQIITQETKEGSKIKKKDFLVKYKIADKGL
jgi:hypothetical protein